MRTGAVVILAAAFLLAATPAAAQEQLTTWALVVNEEPKGDIDVVLAGTVPWVTPEALLKAGLLRVPDGTRRQFPTAPGTWVSLPSLAPAITFRLDEGEIQVLLSADPSLLSASEFALNNPRPEGWKVRSNSSVFLNYSADYSEESGTTGYGEFAFRVFGQLLTTAASVDDKGVVTPGLSSWTVDQVGGRRRWVVGDTIGRGTTLGSAAVVGGISISTEPDLDPYYLAYPSPQIQGAVRTPSTADVYVDGRLVSSVRLPPGRFVLSDLPIEAGLGNARVILRDAFGRQQTINVGFYLSTRMLKRGEQEYSYLAGLERTLEGNKVVYGRPLGTLRHAVGLSDFLTVGAEAEGDENLAAIGTGFQLRLWRLGVFGIEGLASQTAAKERGYAATSAYSFLTRFISLDLRGTWIGPKFQNLYLEPAPIEQINADASTTISMGPLGSLTLGATVGSATDFSNRIQGQRLAPDFLGRINVPNPTALKDALEHRRDRLLRIGYSVNVTSRGQLSVTATRTESPNKPLAWDGFASLNITLGARTMASAVTSVDAEGQALTTVNIQRSLPLGPGYGFRLDAETEEPYRSQGTFEVQHRLGIIGVRASGAKDQDVETIVNVAGSIVAIGGELILSRPVDDGFALVKVPNRRGVKVQANRQPAGRTNRRGSLFVPDLRSYLSNPIGIDQDDLPVEIRLGAVEQNIAVPYRGGAVVQFQAEQIRAVAGRLDTGGEPPAYGTLVVTAGEQRFESPLNAQGDFYFEELQPGEYPAVATWGGQTCRATVRMPAGTETMTDIGAVKCALVPQ